MKLKTAPFFSLALACMLVFPAFTSSAQNADACGVFALGTQKINMSKGETSSMIVSRDAAIDGIKAGPSFIGSADCSGTYEIVDMRLRIATDDMDVNYDYDFAMIRKMQAMEDYMLTRYFIDARTLYFTKIQVKNAQGETMQIQDLSFTIQ